MANQKTIAKSGGALQKLRQIIREEVKNAVKEEIVPILLEVIKHKPVLETNSFSKASNSYSQTLQPAVPSTSNTNSILEQTRREMLAQAGMPASDEYRSLLTATTSDLPLFTEAQSAEPVDQVNAMLATAVKSSKEENVEITNVPDFSSIMKKMNF